MTGLRKGGATTELSPHHEKLLCDSAITPEVIKQRCYQSITDANYIKNLGFHWTQSNVPGLLIPIHHVSEAVAQDNKTATYLQYRPDNPRVDDKGKAIKYEIARGDSLCLDVPPSAREQLADHTIPLFITEGAKKADAAVSHGLCCINLMGVWGWRCKSAEGTESLPLSDWKYINLRHRKVYIAFDSDVVDKPQVAQAMRRLKQFLRSQNATVHTIYLPAAPDGQKVGLDDYFAQGGTVDRLYNLTRRNVTSTAPGDIDSNLPTIETHNRQVRETVDEAISALIDANDPPAVFVSSGRLTRLRTIETEQGEAVRLDTMGQDAMTDRLSRVANFISISQRGKTSVNPPEVVVRLIRAQSEWPGVPIINGVVTSPVFAPDGTLREQPGYNAAAHVYYHATERLELPDTTPTPANVRDALSIFYDDLFIDFPFADHASRAHTLALTLLPFVRSMIKGPTPMHLIDAPRAGTGKSLLASITASVFVPAGISVHSTPKTEDEWRKKLTTVFKEGGSHLLLDNVRELNSEALQAALTAPDGLWADRLLGGNEEGKYPIRCVWATTCNNITGTREQLRRCIWIRLDAKTERPEERSGWHHNDLAEWLRSNRSRVVGASLTLIRAWIEAGQPGYCGRHVMGSFDSWVRVMGGILETVGERNFLTNQQALGEEADSESSTVAAFVEEWWKFYCDKAVTAKQLLPIARRHYEDELGTGGEASQVVKLGKRLSKHRDWVIANKVLKAEQKNHTWYYRLILAEKPCKRGVEGG